MTDQPTTAGHAEMLARIAARNADPRFLCHISDHPGGMDVSELPADCGFLYANVLEAERTADLCAYCADLHTDQPWIQRVQHP